jgi:hypothetical protein
MTARKVHHDRREGSTLGGFRPPRASSVLMGDSKHELGMLDSVIYCTKNRQQPKAAFRK